MSTPNEWVDPFNGTPPPDPPKAAATEARTEPVVFHRSGALQFRCKGDGCEARLTWSRWRTAGCCDCLVDRVNCQDRMMTGRCPHCGQIYAKRINRAQMLPNDALEVTADGR